MESNYEPVSGNLTLQYDAQAQKIFDQAARKLAPLFDFHSSPLRKMMGEEAEEDIVAPLRLLTELGSASQRALQVRPMAMESLLNLICWMALRQSDSQQSVKPFDHALILLSTVTPISVLPVDLPPAVEVFDVKKTNPGVWNAYETLRSWDRNTMPHLYAIQMHQLWLALRRLRRPASSLKALIASLDASIFLFRMTVESLAINEISSPIHGSKKK